MLFDVLILDVMRIVRDDGATSINARVETFAMTFMGDGV